MYFTGTFTFCVLFSLITAQTGPSQDKVIVCYATNETISNGTQFPIEDVDLNLCTHLIYADNLEVTSYTTGPWRDSPETNNYERFTSLRENYPHLKISLAVKHFLVDYLRMASDPGSYWDFAKDASEYLLHHKFDGLDLMWEFSDISDTILQPNQSFGDYSNPNLHFDKEQIHNFVKRLKKTFKLHGLSLTSTFVATTVNIAEVLDIPVLSHHLDYVHFVQKYNFNWKPHGDIISHAITERSINNTEQMINGLIERGVAADKLVMGVQFSGLLFRSIQGLGRFSAATFRRQLGYNEVCDALSKLSGWQKTNDPQSGLTIAKRIELSSGAHLPQLSTIIFESGRLIVRKIQFAVSRKLAGVMVFPIDMDDFVGSCPIDKNTYADFIPPEGIELNIDAHENRKFPLLRTLNEAIRIQLDRNDHPVVAKIKSNIPQVSNIPQENTKVASRFTLLPPVIGHSPLTHRRVNVPSKVRILKIRRPIQTVNIPAYDYNYDDLNLEILDSLLKI